MANKSDDDYWFSSKTKAFDFGDDVSLQKTLNTINSIKTNIPNKVGAYNEGNELTDEFQKSDIPIQSVISKQCLDKLLQRDTRNVCEAQSQKFILEIMNKILLNLPYTLENFKDLQSKTMLLDTAINITDGNAILTVVLFLANTLKKDIFYKLLSTRRIALLHYIHFLSIRLNNKELTNLLILTEYSAIIGLKLFQITVNSCLHDDGIINKLEQLYKYHFREFATEKDNQTLKYYIDLLEWQQNVKKLENMNNISGKSVNKSLAICCQFYWDKSVEHICSIQHVRKSQAISERQLHWIFLDVKSSSQSWEEIQKMFIKNRWFGTRKVITSSLNAENVVVLLGERKAPSEVLERFLVLLEDPEQALNLALRYQCHKYVINNYYSQKDRIALLSYKNKLPPQSEHILLLESMLLSLDN